jgi:hypothetical protein
VTRQAAKPVAFEVITVGKPLAHGPSRDDATSSTPLRPRLAGRPRIAGARLRPRRRDVGTPPPDRFLMIAGAQVDAVMRRRLGDPAAET